MSWCERKNNNVKILFRLMQNKIFPAVTAWAGLYKSEHLSWKVCDTPPCHHLQLEIGIRAGSQAGTSGDASDDTLSIVLTPRVGPGQTWTRRARSRIHAAGSHCHTRMALLFLSARVRSWTVQWRVMGWVSASLRNPLFCNGLGHWACV